jgi:carbonic anhydrase
MQSARDLLESNRRWAGEMSERHPDLFGRLAKGQAPGFLWIGCSDSRVPASQVAGAGPGELFVHRNIANQVVQTDLNLLSVLQYAVDVLKVGHVVVCGHDGCGGVKAALDGKPHGLIDNWLQPIRELAREHADELAKLQPRDAVDRLCELNVERQVANVARSTVVEQAWGRGQQLQVHGLIYQLGDGLLRPLGEPLERPA